MKRTIYYNVYICDRCSCEERADISGDTPPKFFKSISWNEDQTRVTEHLCNSCFIKFRNWICANKNNTESVNK